MAMAKEGVAVVVVPFPAQSHLNQLLHFALNLSTTSLQLLQQHSQGQGQLSVHYACSASHIRQARSRIHGRDANSAAERMIHFHELIPSPPPSTTVLLPPPAADSTTNRLVFPLHALPAIEATMQLAAAPLASLLASLSSASRRLVVVYDPLASFAGHAADSIPGAESYMLHCTPSFVSLSLMWCKQLEHDLNPSPPPPPPPPPPTQPWGAIDILRTPLEDCIPVEFWEFVLRNRFEVRSHAGDLINTCRGIEAEFLDLLAGEPYLRDKKLFAVGPLCPTLVDVDKSGNGNGSGSGGGGAQRHECCLEWLDKQPPASVVYVSFGSTCTISDEQVRELALGLQRSRQRFIWVLRDADSGDVFADDEGRNICRQRELPTGFEEAVEGVGVVVRGWAPQLEILAHPSTGAFVSHCGWNSCMESMTMGVPIVAWPMHTDQPRNGLMVTNYWKIGVSVRDWAQRREVVPSAAIEESIRKVMMCDDEGTMMRKRARSLSQVLRAAISEGGSSRLDLDSFIAHITR